MNISSGVVTLMLTYDPWVICTRSPMNSTMDTSSVTSYPFSLTSSNPRLRRSGLMTCGVCISQSLLRSSVLAMDGSSFASLTVALQGTASTAAPCSMASEKHRVASTVSTRGRAES